ncbi:MAG: carbohydrate kinase family protein [Eubacteriales bacterium]|nr:carbohydrate kinase family protein [Eubacteriales bacterium]
MVLERTGIALGGNLILDYYKEIDSYPTHSTLSTIRRINREPGGLASNCALALSHIDPKLPLVVIGRLGADEAGEFIREKLMGHSNIDLSHLVIQGSTSFTDAMIDLAHKTRTYFQFRGANADLCAADFDLERLSVKFLHVGYILLLDQLDAPDPEFGTQMARLLQAAQAKGIRTSIDIVSEASDRFIHLVPPALRYSDYVIINEYEAAMTTGLPVRDFAGNFRSDLALDICRALFAMGVSTWVILHSREGAVGMSATGEQVVLPSLDLPTAQIVSTIGAGDAFLSGCLYGAYQGRSLQDAMKIGIAASTASLTHFNSTEGILAADELRSLYDSMPKEMWPALELN